MLAGLLGAVAAGWLVRRLVRVVAEPPVLPAGDLLVPMTTVARGTLTGAAAVNDLISRAYRSTRAAALDLVERTSPARVAERAEGHLGRWRASGLALLAVAAVVLMAGWPR